MAFIQPTIDDVRHCSNALSVDPAETDAARTIAEHYSKISNQGEPQNSEKIVR